MMILIPSIIGTILSLGGNIFIAKKNRIGFVLWFIGNVVWIAVNIIGTVNIPMVLKKIKSEIPLALDGGMNS